MRKLLFFAALTVSLTAAADQSDEGRLLRFPSVGGDKIAFTYAGDLYTVPIDGGQAVRLTSDVGFEMLSKFSPDGQTIAFTAQYDGNTEVYTIPSQGGVPQRITWSATVGRDNVGDRMGPNNIVMGWTPDGKNIVYRSKWYCFSGFRGIICTVPATGGDPVEIPSTEGGYCSYSPDGTQMAFNRMFREFRTWKYYRGGQADDIWVNEVGTNHLEKITDNEAQDICPMWVGQEIYYLSDRDSIMNLFCYDTKTKATRKVTDFEEFDCKFPSCSNDWIVFENGGYIYKYGIKSQKCEKVTVYLRPEARYARETYSEPMVGGGPGSMFGSRSFDLSPDGQRALMTVHGDVVSLPASEGAIYDLTNTPGAHERDARWSPDGKHIAYFSDVDGEYQVYMLDSQNPDTKTKMTEFTYGYPDNLKWSPDSKFLYFTKEERDFYSLDVETKTLRKIWQGEWGGVRGYDISPDGAFIAFGTTAKNNISVVNIYDVKAGRCHTVTTPWYESGTPLFSGDGKYLFFTSTRGLLPRYSQLEWNTSYDVSSTAWVLPLAKTTPNPTLIKGDEYGATKSEKEPKPGKESDGAGDGKDAKGEKAAVAIDFDGIVERAVELPMRGASRMHLAFSSGDELFFYEGGELKKISMKDMEIKPVGKTHVMAITADRKKALVAAKGGYHIVSAPAFKAGEGVVPVKDALVRVDYHQEWRQIFDETWRIFRDGFYVKNMVGKPWQKIHDKYAQLLPYVNHRHDLTYIMGEMVSELATGHCYVTSGGETVSPKIVATGLLGGKFSRVSNGAYRIDHIFESVSWSSSLRSPLGEPGLGVKEGDYIIAVNQMPVSDMTSIYESLVGKVDKTVALKVTSTPDGKNVRTIYVKPVADESQLAYYEWVKRNMKIVSDASDGEIGYIHIPDMGREGLDMFARMFYTQLDKKALIIDDRMNGGGNVSPMILERLQREAYRMTMSRNGGVSLVTVPGEMHYGPKVCLIDKYSASDGDLFPYGFRESGIGKLIGKRTWGGIVGIYGSKPYLDGQDVRTAAFTSYSTDGKWIIENRGVEPDIDIDINPFDDYNGKDAQLLKAVEVLKEELKNWKPLPGVPAAPVR